LQYPKIKAPGSSIKKEHHNLTKIDHNFLNGNLNISTLVSEIIKQLNSQAPSTQGNQASVPTSGQRVHSFCCVFCSEIGHFLKGCTGELDRCATAVEYIQKGLCMAGDNGQIVLPNGEKIYAPEKNIKERLDYWNKNNAPSVSTNFVGVTEASKVSGFIWTEVDEEDLPQVTQRDIEELEILESLVSLTQKKIGNTKQKISTQSKDKNAKPATKARQEAEKKTLQQDKQLEQLTRTTEPQYRYVTPIKDPGLAKDMIKQTLETLVMISTRKLLSLAPDIQKQVKEMLTTKRVPQTATAAFVEEGETMKKAGVFMTELAT
jgi:hypothetical protein